jgi:hypothetical protein
VDSARRAEETASTSTVPNLKRYSLVLAALPLGVAVSAHGQAGLLQNHYETRLHPREAWKTWEGIDLSVRMAATATYDDNITIRKANPLADLIWNATPGVAISAGDYYDRTNNFFVLDYAPNFAFFKKYDQNNTIDQHADLLAQYA